MTRLEIAGLQRVIQSELLRIIFVFIELEARVRRAPQGERFIV